MVKRYLENAADIPGKTAEPLSLKAFLTRLIFLCVLPLVLLAIYLAMTHVRTLQAQYEREGEHQARNVAAAIDRQINTQIAALQLMTASPLLSAPQRLDEFYQEARAFRDNFGGNVILADPSMQMLLFTRQPYGTPLPKLPRPKGRAAAPTALETGKPAVGDMFTGRIIKEPLVAVAVPVIRDGRTKCVLLSIIETSQFRERLSEVSLPADWTVALFDGQGEVMARRSPPGKEADSRVPDSPRRFVARTAAANWSVVLDVPSSAQRAPLLDAEFALAGAPSWQPPWSVSWAGSWLAAGSLPR
jgi:hypothetical protein